MKKVHITVSYDGEKFDALKLYLQQRNLMIEDEMISALDSLYNKVVPTGVRDFIDMRAGLPKPAEKKKKPRTNAAEQPGTERSEID